MSGGGGAGTSTARQPLLLLLWTLGLAWLVGLAAGQGGQQGQQTCPPLADILPCGCTVKKNGLDILCEATETQHISKAMDALKRHGNAIIFYLKLRHNVQPKLQQFVFLGLDISHLTIHNSSLAVVEESSLSSVGKKLTQLDLSQNVLTAVPSKALSTLHHLLILNMNHNKINAIHANAFLGLDTLEILTLYENKIDNVDPDAFEGLGKKLKRLNLGGNALKSVPQHALNTLEMLRKLEMQENGIAEINEGDFAGLRKLDSLNLQHNHLNSVPARVFSHLTELNSLELENNQIKTIDPEAFSGLEENLQYLRLGDNKLDAIPSEALRRLHRLRHLDLRVNSITSIPDDAFAGFGDSITFLNLQKNALGTDLESDSIATSRTAVGSLIVVLKGGGSLARCSFSLPKTEVATLRRDYALVLSILTLPNPMVFENLNSLERLILQNNKLEHLSEEVMEPIMDTVRQLDVSDNPLACTCDLSWYAEWYKRVLADGEEPAAHKRRTVCYMHSEHREYSLLSLPLSRMSCVGKNMGQTSASECLHCHLIRMLGAIFSITVTAFWG